MRLVENHEGNWTKVKRKREEGKECKTLLSHRAAA